MALAFRFAAISIMMIECFYALLFPPDEFVFQLFMILVSINFPLRKLFHKNLISTQFIPESWIFPRSVFKLHNTF